MILKMLTNKLNLRIPDMIPFQNPQMNHKSSFNFVLFIVLLTLVLSCNLQSKSNDELSEDIEVHHDTANIYYHNGNIKAMIIFNDIGRHGECKWYFPNGIIESIENYFNGLQVGDNSYYYLDGRLKSYLFYDYRGELRYSIQVDSNSHQTIEDGKPLYATRNFKVDSISGKNLVYIGINCPLITDFTSIIKYKIIDSHGSQSELIEYIVGGKVPLLTYESDKVKDCSLVVYLNFKSDVYSIKRADSISVNLFKD